MEFPGTKVVAFIGLTARLHQRAGSDKPGGIGQLRKFFQRLAIFTLLSNAN
jgi:hypothetical protein